MRQGVRSARALGYGRLGIHSREELQALLSRDVDAGKPGFLDAYASDAERLASTDSVNADGDVDLGVEAVSANQESVEGRPAARNHKVALVLVAGLCLAVSLAYGRLHVQGNGAASGLDLDGKPAEVSLPSEYDHASTGFVARDEGGTILFGVNASGQRFGRQGFVATYMGGRADLYAAWTKDGRLAYIRASDRGSSHPALYDQEGNELDEVFWALVDDVDGPTTPRLDSSNTAFVATDAGGAELFGINKNGQRFGDQEYSDLYLNGILDLKAARGKGGKRGYVYNDDAHAWEAEQRGAYPVFASDGVTQVDVLEFGGR